MSESMAECVNWENVEFTYLVTYILGWTKIKKKKIKKNKRT